jgi:hypothetical protein
MKLAMEWPKQIALLASSTRPRAPGRWAKWATHAVGKATSPVRTRKFRVAAKTHENRNDGVVTDPWGTRKRRLCPATLNFPELPAFADDPQWVTHFESHVGDVGVVGDEGKGKAHRRSSIDDNVRPSPTRSVGEKEVSERVSRPPCDQFFELGRRQGIWAPWSAESSRARTMVCPELLEVRELALEISELVDLDWDCFINARPTSPKRTPVGLIDADGKQMHVEQPTVVLPSDFGAAN